MVYHTFVSGEVLTAANVMNDLMNQSVIVCTSGTRPASPVAGMLIYQTDTTGYWTYSGTAWVPFGQAHLVQVSKATTASFTQNTYTSIGWDVEDFDTDAFHESVTNPSRITIPTGLGGKYRVKGKAAFNGQSAGTACNVTFAKNGALVTTAANRLGMFEAVAAGGTCGVYTEVDVALVAGDYIEMYVFSSAAAPSLLANASNPSESYFAAEFIGS